MRHFALGSIFLLASAQLGLAEIISVFVGGTALRFEPQSVTAQVGDIIRFSFRQKNHTVTQSSFEAPCQALPNGFNSGFVPVAADKTTDFQTAELLVRDTNPIWAYCRQGTHCTSGMVFAVNPGTQFPAFQAAATQGTPGSSRPPTASSTTSAPVPTGSSTNHLVTVGGPGILAFSPTNLLAQPGDTITFQFRQKNHTVTASSFESPCADLSASGQSGWDSGFKPVGDGTTDFPTYILKVNDSKPIWAYCKQGTHCSSAGMVFAANTDEKSSKNFAAFQALAKGSGSTTGYPPSQSSAAWRPSPSMAYFLGLFAVAFLL